MRARTLREVSQGGHLGDYGGVADRCDQKPRPLIKLSFHVLRLVSLVVAHKDGVHTRIFNDLTDPLYHVLCCLTPIGLVASLLQNRVESSISRVAIRLLIAAIHVVEKLCTLAVRLIFQLPTGLVALATQTLGYFRVGEGKVVRGDLDILHTH